MSDVFGSVKNPDSLIADNIKQKASVIKYYKEVFMKSAKEAVIKIVTKFYMKDAAALNAELAWEQVCMPERAFTETFSFDVFGSEKELRNYIGKFTMPFESETFTNESAKVFTVSYPGSEPSGLWEQEKRK